jgi:hypothetical protein
MLFRFGYSIEISDDVNVGETFECLANSYLVKNYSGMCLETLRIMRGKNNNG